MLKGECQWVYILPYALICRNVSEKRKKVAFRRKKYNGRDIK